MRFVRVTAGWKDQGEGNAQFTVTILCAIDDKRQLVDGDWFGYVRDGNVTTAFVLQRGTRFFYGGDEQYYELTNFGKIPIAVGRYFTLKVDDTEEDDAEEDGVELVLVITHCYEYEDVSARRPRAAR